MGPSHRYLGVALDAQHRLVEAEMSFLEAIRLAPEDAENYTSLGCVLYDQQRFAEAETAFQEALPRNPHDPTARTNLDTARTKRSRR